MHQRQKSDFSDYRQADKQMYNRIPHYAPSEDGMQQHIFFDLTNVPVLLLKNFRYCQNLSSSKCPITSLPPIQLFF